MDKINENNEEFWKSLDNLLQTSKIVIDRPKGSAHPRYADFIYPVDYGYIENSSSMDGGGIDIWVGSQTKKKIDAIMCIFDILKRDSEIKILYGCDEIEKNQIYNLHNGKYMKGVMVKRNTAGQQRAAAARH